MERVTGHRAPSPTGWTPLHEACNYGHVQMAELLLKHHADSHARGMDGDTPLHDAVINGHLKVGLCVFHRLVRVPSKEAEQLGPSTALVWRISSPGELAASGIYNPTKCRGGPAVHIITMGCG